MDTKLRHLDQKETLMSKGLGRLQVEMLRIIEADGKPLSTFELAAMLYHPAGELTPSQIKATGRAVRGLVKRGNVQKEGHGRDGRARWAKAGYENPVVKAFKEKMRANTELANKRLRLLLAAASLPQDGV
jgi:hypothetical protein